MSTPKVELDAAVAAVEHHPGRQAVLHGRVLEAGGDAVPDAVVRVERRDGPPVLARSGERGYFTLDLDGACARYEVVLSVRKQDHAARTAFDRRLCPGEAVEVDARVTSVGQLVWIPIR